MITVVVCVVSWHMFVYASLYQVNNWHCHPQAALKLCLYAHLCTRHKEHQSSSGELYLCPYCFLSLYQFCLKMNIFFCCLHYYLSITQIWVDFHCHIWRELVTELVCQCMFVTFKQYTCYTDIKIELYIGNRWHLDLLYNNCCSELLN